MAQNKTKYFHKYLKYKNKYLDLVSNINMTGGAVPVTSPDYTIYWVRHAESCSNYNNDYTLDLQQGTTDFKTVTPLNTKCKSIFELEPPLSYNGMNQAIRLGIEYFSIPSKEIQDDTMFISSPLVRTLTTALLALRGQQNKTIIVIPFINETGHIDFNMELGANKICIDAGKLPRPKIDRQNQSIPSAVLENKMNFIQNWIKINWQKYADIELLTILTKLSTEAQTDPTKKQEIENLIQRYKKLLTTSDKFVELFKDFLDKQPIDSDFRKTYNAILTPTFPQIDYSKYKHYERTSTKTVYKSNYLLFKTLVLPELLTKTNRPIYAFVHNGLIKDLFTLNNVKPVPVIKNTTIIKQVYTDPDNHQLEVAHVPKGIRYDYPDLDKNFPNVCTIPEDPSNDLMHILNKETRYVPDEVYIDEP